MEIRTVSDEGRTEIITSYARRFELVEESGCAFVFPCNEQGDLDASVPEPARYNYARCLDGTYVVRDCGIVQDLREMRLCACGSGEHPRVVHDARGIPVANVCSRCETTRLATFRPEIFTNANYAMDEDL